MPRPSELSLSLNRSFTFNLKAECNRIKAKRGKKRIIGCGISEEQMVPFQHQTIVTGVSWLETFWKGFENPGPKRKVLMEARDLPYTSEPIANFTPRAQQVLALSRKEADRLNHNFVGTEHLLLGLIALGQGTAVNVLRRLGLDLETVRLEVKKQIGTGPDQKLIGNIPYTPRVKKVLTLAAKEARALNHTYVGTEHILLGILREGDGIAARVLQCMNVDIEQTRLEILKELDPNFSPADRSAKALPSNEIASMTPRAETPQDPRLPDPKRDLIDTSQRYDVYCAERNQQVVIYRNARFKSLKMLFQQHQYDVASAFIELEQVDGQIIFIARSSIIKFCEHGSVPGGESAAGKSS